MFLLAVDSNADNDLKIVHSSFFIVLFVMFNIEWLLDNLTIQNTVYHMGKYCGAWKGSTAGAGKASYHIIMEGTGWLHHGSQPIPTFLQEGDMVLFLQDCPFVLSGFQDREEAFDAPQREMQPMTYKDEEGTALTCGFITFTSVVSKMILHFLPQMILFRKQDDHSGSVRKLVDVITQEAIRTDHKSEKLVVSLTEMIFFMVIRQQFIAHPLISPLGRVPVSKEFLHLLAEIVLFPDRDWTVENMAQASGMSRSWFTQRFSQASPLSPADMVRHVRIALACQAIDDGVSLTECAEKVGYQSQAAFSRAFQRVTGETPGRYSRKSNH
ncbi:AraC family transcriptional regulator [Pantoea sp. App145]|uniref:AraC family transcriptional regulator n=1 Tax=Pantoea sp. App145 TaxID=3071567 RepID=UPI003A811775